MPGGRLDDFSGTITTGGVSQLVAAHNVSRSLLLIQNVSTADLWVNFGVPAVATTPSIKLNAGGSLSAYAGWIPSGAVHILGSITGQAFTVKEG